MNERIRELAEQAGLVFIRPTGMLSGLSLRGQEHGYQKFAELIVRECAEVLLKWKQEPFPFDEDLAASLIKEHFGVK